MKKLITLTAMVLVAGSALALFSTGFGSRITATTTPAKLDGFTANQGALVNQDSTNYIFVLANTDTNTLATRITAGTAIPVPPNSSWTFDCNGKDHVYNICYATTNGTASADFGSF